MKLTKGSAMRENCEGRMNRSRTGVRQAMSWLTRTMVLATLLCLVADRAAEAQAVATTTVQGTVYLANGQPGAGTLVVSWPAFTTAAGQAVAAGRTSVTIAPDGFMSVKLTPNLGATPAGLFYTAVYQLSDGSANTEYWVVPSAAQAALGSVRAQVMPAAQAVQAVTKAYVDQAVSALNGSYVPLAGGTMTGPLTLSADPTQPLHASDKHYVDQSFAKAVLLAGGNMTGALTTPSVNGKQSPSAVSAQMTLQAAVTAAGTTGAVEIPPTYTGTDTFSNSNGVYVKDWRTGGAQQAKRSVKEFGAVCDGSTDDTSALQTALNYANAHGVALTIPQGVCKTHTLTWRGESIGGAGKQVSALKGFPGEDVLATPTDSTNILSYTRLHDLTIYVDQSVDASCATAKGRGSAGSCAMSRPIENNSIFSPGANGLTATAGTGAGWYVGNCAIAMPGQTGAGGNGLKVASIENVEIAATGTDPLASTYAGAYSTHTCGMYLAQWPRWSEFRNIDIRGMNTGIAMPALAATTPAGLNADSNRWENITIQAAHGFVAAAGSNNVLDNIVAQVGNSSATGEPPTGLALDLTGTQYGWTVRNATILPTWTAVQPSLTVAASAGAITGVMVGTEHGLGFDPYGTSVPVKFSGSCTAAANALVNSDGSIGAVTVTQGGVGCSVTTTASIDAAGTWDTAAPVNLIGGQNLSFVGGNLLKGTGGYTVWNATSSETSGTQVAGGGGNLPGGGTYGPLAGTGQLGKVFDVDQFPGPDFGAKLQACVNAVNATYGGTCDARNFTGTQSMSANVTIAASNTTVLLPCATIATANQLIVAAGARNVSLRGCALRGGSQADGSKGGTAIAYTGSAAAVQVGDATYAADTLGFHMDNVAVNTVGSSSASAQGLAAYRTQEMDVESVYFLGNQNQTGMTLDGTGNYTGGTYYDVALNGFQTAVNAIGHQATNSATTDWMNASTFVRLHINCPTSGGSPIAGTYGINLQAGDGNTFTGGDVEGCATAMHLGASAKNNTIVGLRNENSTSQVVADAGSAYNNWMTGGTMFTGALTDNGTRNSFLDTFHRSFNGLNGDWYGSQADATVTNHYRLGTGAGNERGYLNRYQTDYGYRWTVGLSDAAAGEQFYQVLDELNNVNRVSIGQYNNGQSSTNNQTAINSAGTGAVVLNGSNNAGTGGVVIGSGGTSATTVATIDKAGNTNLAGTLQVAGATTLQSTPTVKNGANAEIDMTLWAGSTAAQKEAFIYKDYTGASQWYMVKDAANNWALNSAVGGLDSFKAYQSTNSGDTYINASNTAGAVRINYEPNSGSAFNIYGGGSSVPLYASFTGAAAIKFPGLSASSGHNCLQIDSSGYITNTGSGCGSNTTSGTTVSSGTTGQIAYYTGNGTSVGGETNVPVTAGGTGATTAAAGLANLGGVSTTATTAQAMAGVLSAPGLISATSPYTDIRAYGAVIDGSTDIGAALQSALNAVTSSAGGTSSEILLPCGGSGCYLANGTTLSRTGSNKVILKLQGVMRSHTTLKLPENVLLYGDAGAVGATFQSKGPTASVTYDTAIGTIASTISTTNAPVTFTPTFTSGSPSNIPVGSAITIAGQVSCSATGVAYSAAPSTPMGSANVIYTAAAQCRIPPGALVTVTGCSDANFNIAGTPVHYSDFPLQQIGISSSTLTSGTATGCTLTGFDEDSFETVQIAAVSGSMYTATFAHPHSASDQWGMVGAMYEPHTFSGHDIENIALGSGGGAAFWGMDIAAYNLVNDGFGVQPRMTSIGAELDDVWWGTIRDSNFQTYFPNWCLTNCTQPSYPQGLRCSQVPGSIAVNGVGCSVTSISDSTIYGGIKVDTNGMSPTNPGTVAYGAQPGAIHDVTIEEPNGSGIRFDNRYVKAAIKADGMWLQDNFLGATLYEVYATDHINNIDFTSYAKFDNLYPGGLAYACANTYFTGKLDCNNTDGTALTYGRSSMVGTVSNGGALETELRGIGAGFGPSLIPFATFPVSTSITCSTCSTVQGPDGTSASAVSLEGTGSGVSHGVTQATVNTQTMATYKGDWILYGTWVKPPADKTADGFGGSNTPMRLWSWGGLDTLEVNTKNFGLSLVGDWWHPQVGLATFTSGSTTPHNIDFLLSSPYGAGNKNSFYGWFWMYIPGPNNPAYTGVTIDEVERWRQQLMHGYVPPSMPSGGGLLAMHPSHKLYWGNDTDLYRSASGVLKTDGAVDAGMGYKCQGSYGTAGQVLTTTGSGCQWTGLTTGLLSFTGDGVVLSNQASTGSVTATLKAVSPNQVLAGPASGSAQSTPTYRALTSADLPVSIASNTSGTAASLSSASVLPNGTTASTQAQGDGSTQVATTAYVDTGLSGKAATNATTTVNGQSCALGSSCTVAATPGGTAGGDLSGSYPIPVVVKVNGGAVPAGASLLGTNSSGQLVNATNATLANNTTGNAATATALATTPSQCTAGTYSTGVSATGAANCSQVNASQLGAGALASGTTATTQTQGDNSARVATTSYVDTGLNQKASVMASTVVNGTVCALGNSCSVSIGTATSLATVPTQCPAGYAAAGIQANGNATGCIAVGSSSSVAGPGLSVSGDLAIFNGTTGGVLKDSGMAAANIATTTQAIALAKGTTAVTQTQGDGSTKVATTAYVDAGLSGKVDAATTVNGHVLSGNVTVSASDITAGTLPHAQLPTLESTDIPNNAASTTGNAATATALEATPTTCATGYAPTGILANGNVTGCAAVNSGSVTSVGLSIPGSVLYAVNGSPVTGSGTLTLTPNTQTANTFLAGPASGSTAAAPTFRAIASTDLPVTIAANTTGTAAGITVAGTYDFTTASYPSGLGCSGSGGSYTCTAFPTGTHMCVIYVVGGGPSGGSGAVCSSSSTCYGGGGASGADVTSITIPCSALGSGTTTASVPVYVGAGAAGGTAQSTSSSSGSAGSQGTTSYIGGNAGYLKIAANSGNPGGGGTTSNGSAGGAGAYSYSSNPCAGAAGGSGAGGTAMCFNSLNVGPGGGAGGAGLVAGTTAAGGGAGASTFQFFGSISNNYGGAAGGGAGRTPSYASAATSTTYVYAPYGGTGGGSNCTGNGGTGGTGMFPGGGGAGGGAACNGYSSGAGGRGGDGVVRVIIY